MQTVIKKLFLVLLTITYFSSFGQKTVKDQSLVWYGYFLTLQFNDRWYWQTELQERHFIKPTAQHQFLVRTHLHRDWGGSWETSVGVCLFLQNPNEPTQAVILTVPELRPHIEFGYKQNFKYARLDHRFRTEARIYHNTNETRTALEDGFSFGNFRFRYRLQATIPVWKIDENRALKIKLSDEILLNGENKIAKNIFEQNRIYAGLSIDLLPNLTFDVGYLNWFQQQPSDDFYNRHILRFTAFHKVNLHNSRKDTK